ERVGAKRAVLNPGGVAEERLVTHGDVTGAAKAGAGAQAARHRSSEASTGRITDIALERAGAKRGVLNPVGVGGECQIAERGVVVARGIGIERLIAERGVVGAGGVRKERPGAKGGVLESGGVGEKRLEAKGGVGRPGGVAGEHTRACL